MTRNHSQRSRLLLLLSLPLIRHLLLPLHLVPHPPGHLLHHVTVAEAVEAVPKDERGEGGVGGAEEGDERVR